MPIAPDIRAGKRVLIAAHGNSLRALVKYLDNVSEQDILELNIPTGIPLVYLLNEDLKPLQKYYLGDQDAVQEKMAAVANQGKAWYVKTNPKSRASDLGLGFAFLVLTLDGRFLRLVSADAQRTEEALVVRRQFERPARRQQARGRRDLRHGRAIIAVDKTDNRFECHLHIEAGFACLRAARLNLGIFGNGSGDRVGQLFCEPVHDVIHTCFLLTPPPGRDPGRFPIRTCTCRGGVAGIGRQRCSSVWV